jgi:hypothetical protein
MPAVENFFLRKFSIATHTRSSFVTLTLRFANLEANRRLRSWEDRSHCGSRRRHRLRWSNLLSM